VSRITSYSEWLLRQPLIWGGLACLAFYALVVHGAPEGSLIARYFAGHTIAYCTTGMFFVGLAALGIRALGLGVQFSSVDRIRLSDPPLAGQHVDETAKLLAELDNEPETLQQSYLICRLRQALESVQKKASADSLEKHLRYLEDVDQARMSQGYGLVRIVISVIPILGFLGTVIGITLAIAQLNLSGTAVEESLSAVVGGLSVAFDTTALALTLSTLLLFTKFSVERVELRLLSAVDTQADQQLIGRFRQYGTANDPHLASVQRMSEKLLESVQASAKQQTEALMSTVNQAARQWSRIVSKTGNTLDETLATSVVKGLSRHAELLNEGVAQHRENLEATLVRHAELLNEGLEQHTAAVSETEMLLSAENRKHLADVQGAVGETILVATNRQEKLIRQSEEILQEMQQSLVESAGTTVAQQEQLVAQGDILLRVVEATGQVKKLEESLNSNLNALAGTRNFEETVAGLSAVLQLLSTRLGQPLSEISRVVLQDEPPQNKAA